MYRKFLKLKPYSYSFVIWTITINRFNMLVEIWSDIVCPFCYIGKRKFEQALEKFPQKDQVKVVWKSFQLDPEASTEGTDYVRHLSDRKGWSEAQTRQITDNVSQMAAEVGLEYHFEKAIAANSLLAHRFAHLAAAHGLQDAAHEALFKAHFTEGKNISDPAMLLDLGVSIGLDLPEMMCMLNSDDYTDTVQADLKEATELRITWVPYFVFDRKYAVSGAQASDLFLNVLHKVLAPETEVA